MLSGSPTTINVSAPLSDVEGGFLTVNSLHLFSAGSNDFVQMDTAFGRRYDISPTGLFDTLNLADQVTTNSSPSFARLLIPNSADMSVALNSGDLDLGNLIPRVDIVTGMQGSTLPIAESAIFEPPLPTETNEIFSTYLSPSLDQLDYDLGPQNFQVQDPLVVTPPIKDNGPIVSGDSLTPIVDEPLTELHGLSGKTAKILTIEEPIQLSIKQEGRANRQRLEGGMLEVMTTVAATQRAYETQLAAVAVRSLNPDGDLPITPPLRSQPVVAELARAVAFETVSYRLASAESASEQLTDDPIVEPPRTDSANLQTEGQREHESSVSASTQNQAPSGSPLSTSEGGPNLPRSTPVAESIALTERIDNEHDPTIAVTFARWPLLATVLTSYLLVERRVQSDEVAVQTPPRRHRDQPTR